MARGTRTLENGVQLTAREALNNATLLVGVAATLVVAPNKQRTAVEVFNDSGATVYLGGSAVTTANGRPIANGTGYAINAEASCDVYLIAAAPSTVRVLSVA